MSFDVWSVLSRDALLKARKHVLDAPEVEVGGFLLGFHGEAHEAPRVVVAVEAWDAEGDLTRLTFTHAAWEHVHRVQDDLHPETSIVGWYHSHPGHGIFLSEHDRFIQRHFFGAPWQIAVVIDPIAGTEGMFAWARGEIVPISERFIDGNGEARSWSGAEAFTPRTAPVAPVVRRRLIVELEEDGVPALVPAPVAPPVVLLEPSAPTAPPPPAPSPSPRPAPSRPTRRASSAGPALLWLAAALAVVLAVALLVLR